jgi:hypothetical protein
MKIGRGNRSTRRKPTPAPLCPPQNPTWLTQSRAPDLSGRKPATNRLSYGAAFFSPISSPLTTRRVMVEVFDPVSTRVIRMTKNEPRLLSRYSDGLRAGRLGFDSRQEQDIFLYSTVSIPAVTHAASSPMGTGSSFPEVKRPGREADCSLPTSSVVNNRGAIPPLPYTPLWLKFYATGK